MSVAEPPSLSPLPLPEPPHRRPKIKKRRLLLIVLPLMGLALVSTVFGMMMAVASDLPALESDKRFQNAKNSILLDDRGRELGVLVNNQNLVYDTYDQISPTMRHAIIAVEDKRFYTNSGVDIRGIGRAFFADVFGGGGTQGGSTITEQFVKNALVQQSNRTVFEKLREAALAYHLTRKWSKNKILTEYLNTIYFGNGAYGIESAARIYFGADHKDPNNANAECGTRGEPMCASLLNPEESALLAGMVANPSGYDPQTHWKTALARRNLVLKDMLDQGYLTQSDYRGALSDTAPPAIQPPQDLTTHSTDLNLGYFNTWVRQQLVDRYGPKIFRQGWRIRTTLDLDLQKAAEGAVRSYFPPSTPDRPTAAMAVIDNKSGEVRAMVGGLDYQGRPFNLATQAERQPGSSFKPFVLAAALKKGISPNSVWPSRKRVFDVPGTHGKEKFVVNNFEGTYAGERDLTTALTYSDNSVFAAVAYATGFHRIATIARAMGIRSPVSTNPAIALGGLKTGVDVLDMAHAYETLAEGGNRVEGTLGAPFGGPIGIRRVEEPKSGDKFKTIEANHTKLLRVLPKGVVDEEVPMMERVITQGTGTKARIPGIFEAGKTGTTENYGDAWFVAFTDKYTVAVWVGYPDSTKSMAHDYGGAPVEGGTYPALIWRAFMVAALQIDQQRALAEAAKNHKTLTTTVPIPSSTPVTPVPSSTTPSSTSTTGGGTSPTTGGGTSQQTTPATTPATPAPTGGGTSTTPSSTGGVSPSGTGGAAPPPGGGTQTTGG
jgi:penicillin-binding protein 1A